MIARAAVLALAACLPARVLAQVLTPAEARDSSRASLVRDVTYLASKELAGRATGTPGNDSAAVFISRRYLSLQIDPGMKTTQCDSTGACAHTYFQKFRTPMPTLRDTLAETDALAHNVVAIIPGTDSALEGEWIVVGAHYDHLGQTGVGAMDRATATAPHLGADDNASGTAAVLELALRLAAAPLRRSVMFVHFGAEEIGLVGSTVFVANSPMPVDSITAMVNLDMVGHLGRGRLQLFGLQSAPEWRSLVARANETDRMGVLPFDDLGLDGSGSDHERFFRAGVPVIHLFTGTHRAYHTKDDTVEIVDFDGLVRVVDFAERLIRVIGDDPFKPFRR